MNMIIRLIKHEAVLFMAALFASASMIFIPPDTQYLSYLDYSVLAILFSLMIVVAGLKKIGVFDFVSQSLLARTKGVKYLSILLVNCVFVCSMFLTNDVALITFVPITIGIFTLNGRKRLIHAIVMETLAANLGSMLTPIGNPQNLYLYSYYRLDIPRFFQYVLPVGAVSYVLIMGLLLISRNGNIDIALGQKIKLNSVRNSLIYYACLFLLCVGSVLHAIDYRISFILVLTATLIADRKLLLKVDYSLLLTFVCFFIFVGNLERIDAVKNALSLFLKGRVFVVSVLSSQIISNVPAAMMISRFTTDARPLLLGVNIGGLGTPVASLASLISFKLYAGSEGAKPGRYLLTFSLYNLSLLFLLSAIFK